MPLTYRFDLGAAGSGRRSNSGWMTTATDHELTLSVQTAQVYRTRAVRATRPLELEPRKPAVILLAGRAVPDKVSTHQRGRSCIANILVGQRRGALRAVSPMHGRRRFRTRSEDTALQLSL